MRRVLATVLAFAFAACLPLLSPGSGMASEYLSGASSAVQKPMQFAVQEGDCTLAIPCKRWLYAHGRITPDTPARFKAVLDSVGEERILIALNSAGGDYLAAMEMGRMVRSHISPVTVAASLLCRPGLKCPAPKLAAEKAFCDYACLFVLLGGSTRTAPERRDMMLPRLSNPADMPEGADIEFAGADGRDLVTKVDDYLTLRSLSLDLKETILVAPADGWHYVNPQQALAGRLVTGFNTAPRKNAVAVAPSIASGEAVAALPRAGASDDGEPVDAPRIRIASLASYPQPPMDFVLFERAACSGEPTCGRWISAEGLIGPKTPAAFKAFVGKRKLEGLPLMINSAGGDYAAAMEIGRIARERKLKVGVAGSIAVECRVAGGCRADLARRKLSAGQVTQRDAYCDFACLFVLAGGTARSASPDFTAQLPYVLASGESLRASEGNGGKLTVLSGPKGDALEGKVRQYLIEMLLDTELYVSLVRPGNDVARFSDGAALHRYGLTNSDDGPEMLLKPQVSAEPSMFETPPMQFVVAHSTPETCKPECRRWIVADGTITDRSPARLRKLLKSLGKQKLPVVLQSDGGSVGAAVEMGLMIRSAGLDIAVGRTDIADCTGLPGDCLVPAPGRSEIAGRLVSGQAVCASACPLMLAGGKRRFASPWSFIVVHTQFSIKPDDKKHPLPESERMVEAPISIRKPLTRYLKDMGVKPALFDIMRSASATSFRIVAPDEALALHLTTDKAPASQLVGLQAD